MAKRYKYGMWAGRLGLWLLNRFGWKTEHTADLDEEYIEAQEYDDLKKENERLKRGDFTKEEFQNLCHNLNEQDKDIFCDGCDEYQRKLFGTCRTDELKNEHGICASCNGIPVNSYTYKGQIYCSYCLLKINPNYDFG